MILAEELGITQAVARNPARLTEITGKDPNAKHFAELKGGAGLRVIRLVGNYGEVYDRYFGRRGRIPIDRDGTPNELAKNGGAMISRPFR
ncbi:MAG: hypothetical protein HYY39_03165 [Armatimonadetes bacterium]|nr:hypothetical protein [Armatimonadota bacterium]